MLNSEREAGNNSGVALLLGPSTPVFGEIEAQAVNAAWAVASAADCG